MRLRHYSGEITSVDSFTMLAHGTMPASFAYVLLQTCISADASHNVLVVDRHGYDPWRVHATDPLDRHAPAL